MKKTSTPTLYKISSITSKTKKNYKFTKVLFSNLKCDNMTTLINTIKAVKTLGEGSTGHSLKLVTTTVNILFLLNFQKYQKEIFI